MSQLNEEDRAELVAFLDGELEEEEAQAFEARLARDRELRAEAEALKKTWELLDFLPKAEPSTGFTHRTLERLAIHTTGGLAAPGSNRGWAWAAPAAWAAAMFLAIIGGWSAGLFLAPKDNPPPLQQTDVEALILRDLEVIRHKRLYDNADTLDYLRSLATVFDEEGGAP